MKSLEGFLRKKGYRNNGKHKIILWQQRDIMMIFLGLAMLRVLILIEKSQRNLQWVFD